MEASEINANFLEESSCTGKKEGDNDTCCNNKHDNSNNSEDSAISVSDNGDHVEENSKDTEKDQCNEDNKVDKEIKPERNEPTNNTTVYKKNENEEGGQDTSFEVKMRKNRDSSRDKIHNHDQSNHNGNEDDNKGSSSSAYSSSTNTMYSTTTNSTFPMSDDFKVSSTGEDNIRITGYLEKRSKMLGWKKFWFVLDGRLLTYYKSKADYDSLSACCGSINVGIASTVRPIQIRGCKGFPIQIVTRSQVYYLRSLDKQILDHWLIAIQEAASSQPKISFPVWADPGAQFFRYSFAALSQWSLDNSSEDITESLSNLPPNFYLKGGPNRTLSNLHKCHSFASLQSPSLYNTMSLTGTLSGKNPVQLRDKSKDTAQIPTTGKVRQSVSMLMLESSAQAAELKKELTKKLSIGKSGENTVKPSLATSKQKSDLPFLKVSKRNEDPDDETHHYDEIVDFEAIYENYEPSGGDSSPEEETSRTRNPSEGQNENDTDIYESMDAMSPDSRGDPWEKINHNPTDRNSKRNSDNRKSKESNRNSTIKDTEDESNQNTSRHESMDTLTRNFPALPEPPIQTHKTLHKTSSNCSETSSITSFGDSHSLQPDKAGKKKKKTIGGFFQKMFNRDKGKKSKGNQPPMVITGPVDLRSLHHDSRQSPINRPTNLPISKAKSEIASGTIKKSPLVVGSKPSFDENVMDELKLKVGKMPRADTLTPVQVESSVVGKISLDKNRSDNAKPKESLQNPTLDKPFKIATVSSPLILDQVQKSTFKTIPKTIDDLRQSPSEEEWDKLIGDPVIQRRRSSQSEEFQQKLAKFNRLSQRLSSSFVSALNPTPAYPIGRSNSWKIQKGSVKNDKSPALPPKKKNNPVTKPNYYDYPTNNRPIETHKSDNDCSTECNTKSSKISSEGVATPSDKLILTFMRSLNKKNSAPDVIFSSSRSSSGEFGINSKDGGDTDNVFEEILRPPPIPPKSKSSPKSTPEQMRASDGMHYKIPPKKDSTDSNINSEVVTPQAFKENVQLVHILENKENTTANSTTPLTPSPDYGEFSLTPIRKSEDFNLDTLSDLSDTNDNASPACPPKSSKSPNEIFHPNPSYQSNAQTPQFEEQDSLIVLSQSSESNKFARDSLSNTPEIKEHSDPNKDSSQTDDVFENNTVSNTKLDIYLQKHQKNLLRMKTQESEANNDSLEFSSINSQGFSEVDNSMYENLHFATVHTLVQEFETVEETEDEISEMYDDFPTEFLTSVNLPSSACFNQDSSGSSSSPSSSSEPSLTPTLSPSSDRKPYEQISTDSIRHSGIDQLQEYLSLESNNASVSSNDEFRNILGDSCGNVVVPAPAFTKGPLRQGAVSRLGHSSAVDQIQRILKTRND